MSKAAFKAIIKAADETGYNPPYILAYIQTRLLLDGHMKLDYKTMSDYFYGGAGSTIPTRELGPELWDKGPQQMDDERLLRNCRVFGKVSVDQFARLVEIYLRQIARFLPTEGLEG